MHLQRSSVVRYLLPVIAHKKELNYIITNSDILEATAVFKGQATVCFEVNLFSQHLAQFVFKGVEVKGKFM
jgi:hypothetical protein